MNGTRGQQRRHLRAIGKIEKYLNRHRFLCLFPGCKQPAIASHSQQKEGQLRAISEDGRVCALNRNVYQALKSFRGSSILQLRELGIGEASTFPGFCPTHDRRLFADLETRPLASGSEKHQLLLFLRAMSYETAQKRCAALRLSLWLDDLGDVESPTIVESASVLLDGMRHFVEHDGPYYLDLLFRSLEDQQWDRVSGSWKVVPSNIGVSCCSVISLEMLHESVGRLALGGVQPVFSFHVAPNRNESNVIVVWLREHAHCFEWITRAAENPSELELLVNRFAFVESEDTCVTPSKWRRLPKAIQAEVLHAMRHQLFRGSLGEVPIVVRLNNRA